MCLSLVLYPAAAFTGVFVMEMLLKWIAISLGPYFKDSWNVFDFAVVLVSVVVSDQSRC